MRKYEVYIITSPSSSSLRVKLSETPVPSAIHAGAFMAESLYQAVAFTELIVEQNLKRTLHKTPHASDVTFVEHPEATI